MAHITTTAHYQSVPPAYLPGDLNAATFDLDPTDRAAHIATITPLLDTLRTIEVYIYTTAALESPAARSRLCSNHLLS